MTVDDGFPERISLARLGPDITQILFPVKSSSSSSTEVIRFPVLGSRPFVALIAIFSHEIADDNREEFSLIDAAGTANIIRSEFSIASLGDEVIFIVLGKGTPGTNLRFSFSV